MTRIYGTVILTLNLANILRNHLDLNVNRAKEIKNHIFYHFNSAYIVCLEMKAVLNNSMLKHRRKYGTAGTADGGFCTDISKVFIDFNS